MDTLPSNAPPTATPVTEQAAMIAPATRPQQVAVGALSLGLTLLGLYTLWNFLSALVWAAIFAVALWPLYRRAQRRFPPGKHDILLPGLFTLGVALVFVIPIGLVGFQIAHEAHNAMDWMRNAQSNGIPEPDVLKKLPFGQQQVDEWWQANLADPGAARALLDRTTRGHVGNLGREAGRQVARRLTLFVFTLLTLFFLFKQGDVLVQQMRRAGLRTFGANGERLGQQIIASIHGTVDGLVLVGLGEGVLLGIAYVFSGVGHPTIFGAMTAVAAMVPFAAPVVFGLVALLLLAQGSVAWAIAIVCIGFATTFVADHFIRPVLIGGAIKLPFLWVLLGILGGVEEWGLLGLFVGPAIMAALIMLWREWADTPLRTRITP